MVLLQVSFPALRRHLLDNVDVKVPSQGGVPSQLVPVSSITPLDNVSYIYFSVILNYY